MKITRKRWTDTDDNHLKSIVKLFKINGRTMREAYNRASLNLNRTPAACETRWYQLEKNKTKVSSFLNLVGNHEDQHTEEKIQPQKVNPKLKYAITQQLGRTPYELEKSSESLDFKLLQNLLIDQEAVNRKEKNKQEQISNLKEEIKKMADSLDNGTPISNRNLLIVGKHLIDIWFERQLDK